MLVMLNMQIVPDAGNCTVAAPPARCDIYDEGGYTVNFESKRGCISPEEAGLPSMGNFDSGAPKLVCKVEGSGEWAVCNEGCYRPNTGHNFAINCCSGEDCADECEEVCDDCVCPMQAPFLCMHPFYDQKGKFFYFSLALSHASTN